MEQINLRNGWIQYAADFLDPQAAADLYAQLKNELNWESGEITLFGKTYATPRLEAFYAEDLQAYGYSGKKLTVNPIVPILETLKLHIEQTCGATFNSVLANFYRDGQDSNGWHADNEKELGKNPVIASLSLGAVRRFDIRHETTREQFKYELQPGSLLVMGGEMQHYWKHQVAKTKQVTGGRINLTFRFIQH
jgi:alkylated DNA repair dioxygenase AlkB